MKFAKYLEDNLVPEWRIKYLNYKGGKKKLKAIARAMRHAEAASLTGDQLEAAAHPGSGGLTSRVKKAITPSPNSRNAANGSTAPSSTSPNQQHQHSPTQQHQHLGHQKTTSVPSVSFNPSPSQHRHTPSNISNVPSTGLTPQFPAPARDASSVAPQSKAPASSLTPILKTPKSMGRTMSVMEGGKTPRFAVPGSAISAPEEHNTLITNSPMQHNVRAYGSISEAPLDESSRPQAPPSLKLPGPLKSLEERTSLQLLRANTFDSSDLAHRDDPSVGVLHIPSQTSITTNFSTPNVDGGINNAPTINSTAQRPYLRRVIKNVVLKFGGHRHKSDSNLHNAAAYMEETDSANREFFQFLDDELEKITNFYNLKEMEAKERLSVLEHQIDIMNNNRAYQREEEAKEKAIQASRGKWGNSNGFHVPTILSKKDKSNGMPTIANLMAASTDVAAAPTARERLITMDPGRRDYNRRPKEYQGQNIGYRAAKRKIKLAILEYYRSLELLKSYCLLNREGFRKIMKKYDKTTHRRMAAKYLNEKVNSASFATSDELDTLMGKVEDLFAHHWEKGRRKYAVERLRTKEQKKPQTGAMFRVGLYLGVGIPFLVQSLYLALQDTDGDNEHFRHDGEISYLLQVWAGLGLPILFMMLFALCCRAWSLAKINYVFIFEFDTKYNVDWRQLLEIPSFFFCVLSFLMFFTFSGFWGDNIDRIYFPLIFLVLVLVVMFNPFRVCYYWSRRWMLYALWRLFWAGAYPVEFRDFWLGDMFCSLTYTMGTIPLMGCLYHRNWDNPNMCNSSHSRLMGFFTALPGLWRLFQCLRRYRDTRNIFPHLVNGGKYTCTILYYLTISLWRIQKGNNSLRTTWIAWAVINSMYTSIWDLAMDWSLLDWDAPNRMLRRELGFKRPSSYYAAMLVDPPLRFSWIFYLIFENSIQHSAAVSFFISLAEIFRRWIWCFFRLENEHCTNVGRFRAYRDDVPLPYDVPCPGVTGRHASAAMSSLENVLDVPASKQPQPQQTPSQQQQQQEEPSPYTDANRLERADTRRTDASRRTDDSRSTTSSLRRPGARGRTNSTTPIIRALSLVATNMAMAHATDFERRRPPTARSRARSFATSKSVREEEDDEISSDEESAPLVSTDNVGGGGGNAMPTLAERIAPLRRRGTGMMDLSTRASGTDTLNVSDFGGGGNGEGGSNWAEVLPVITSMDGDEDDDYDPEALDREYGVRSDFDIHTVPAAVDGGGDDDDNPVSPRSESPGHDKVI